MNTRQREQMKVHFPVTLACVFLGAISIARLSGLDVSVTHMPEASAAEAAGGTSEVSEAATLDEVVTMEDLTTTVVPIEIVTPSTAEEGAVGGMVVPLDSITTSSEISDLEPLNIFSDPNLARELLIRRGREPFQYNAKGRMDPMILPWVRNEILSVEYLAQARAYTKRAETLTDRRQRNAQYLLAIKECERVIALDSTTRYAEEAKQLKGEIQKRIDPVSGGGGPGPELLPPEVVANTKGIRFDSSADQDHIALIFGHEVRIGEAVPDYPDVKVLGVRQNPDRVLYGYQSYEIEVECKPPILDPWIPANTKAVVYDNSPDHKHLALVGDNLLGINEVVPQFKEVKVADITRDKVIFELQGVRIEVPVEVEVKPQ